MPIVSKTVLKSYFNDGDVPNESNYIDLIDTMGAGDMAKAVYDFDDDGKVNEAVVADSAYSAPWTGISGKPATFPPSAHLHDSDYHRKDADIIHDYDLLLDGGIAVGNNGLGAPAPTDIAFYNGVTRVGEVGSNNGSWLKLNHVTDKPIYTPRFVSVLSLGVNNTTPPPDGQIVASSAITAGGSMVAGGDIRAAGGASIGNNATDVPTGMIYATNDIMTQGGLRAGDLTTDPGAGNLSLSGKVVASIPRAASVKKAVNQSLANNVFTVISIDSELFDEDNMWISPNVFIATPIAGIYIVTASVEFTANSVGARGVNITLSGVIKASQLFPAVASPLSTIVQVSTIIEASGSVGIRMEAFQNSGAALNTVAANNLTFLSVARLV